MKQLHIEEHLRMQHSRFLNSRAPVPKKKHSRETGNTSVRFKSMQNY
jgi:hypothetical protein